MNEINKEKVVILVVFWAVLLVLPTILLATQGPIEVLATQEVGTSPKELQVPTPGYNIRFRSLDVVCDMELGVAGAHSIVPSPGIGDGVICSLFHRNNLRKYVFLLGRPNMEVSENVVRYLFGNAHYCWCGHDMGHI